jgi:hypothetical protein
LLQGNAEIIPGVVEPALLGADTTNLLELAVTAPTEVALPAASAGENDADRLYCPAMPMDSPLKVATPATAATVVVPFRAPDPDAIDRVTDAVDDVTTLPPASVMATTGWVAKTTPVTLADGLTWKCKAVAAPARTVKL